MITSFLIFTENLSFFFFFFSSYINEECSIDINVWSQSVCIDSCLQLLYQSV